MNHQADIDNLIKKMVKEEGLETPSNGFTDKVMHTVRQVDLKAAPYKPLIPKYILLSIISTLVLIGLFLFGSDMNTGKNNSPFLDKIINSLQIFNFNFEISSHISNILISALIMLMIQVMLIGTIYKRIHR